MTCREDPKKGEKKIGTLIDQCAPNSLLLPPKLPLLEDKIECKKQTAQNLKSRITFSATRLSKLAWNSAFPAPFIA